jgi:hypothetical protein
MRVYPVLSFDMVGVIAAASSMRFLNVKSYSSSQWSYHFVKYIPRNGKYNSRTKRAHQNSPKTSKDEKVRLLNLNYLNCLNRTLSRIQSSVNFVGYQNII